MAHLQQSELLQSEKKGAVDGQSRWPGLGKTGQLPHPLIIQEALSWSLNRCEIPPLLNADVFVMYILD